jgi:cullin 1
LDLDKNSDLARMYSLVCRISEGLNELKAILEAHIHNQGLSALAKCGEAASNVN